MRRKIICQPTNPGRLWPKVVALEKVLSMGQIELNYELLPRGIAWNRTVFVCKTELFEIFTFSCV